MAEFIYKAIDPVSRKQVSVNISASTQTEANRLVIERGLRPISVKEAGKKAFSFLSQRVKRKDKILLSSKLATLLDAGLPLLQSIRVAADQTSNKELQRIVRDIGNSIESGINFSDALKKYPQVFDNIFINLVKAGEASGTLDIALGRLAKQQEKDGELVSKVKSAMVYPVIVIFVMILVVIGMLVFVLPRVTAIYEDLGAEERLPFLTKALISVSDFLRTGPWNIIAFFGFIGVLIGISRWLKTKRGKRFFDKFKITAPVLKNIYINLYMARFTRTIGTLFGSGVNLITSLEIMEKGINNVHLEGSVGRMNSMIQEGSPLSVALKKETNFEPLVSDLVKVGEESGKTEDMLMKAADYYEKEVDKQLKALTTILEPVLIVVLGGIAMTIILAILLPIYNLVNEKIG